MVSKIISQVLFSQFTVSMYHELTDHAPGVMCEGLPTGKTWMLEQSETSELKLFLTDTGCAHFGDSKRLFILPVVLCLPSMLQYDIRSKRIIFREVFIMHWDISLCIFNFLCKLEEQKFPQNRMPNFWKFCAKLMFWLMKNSS